MAFAFIAGIILVLQASCAFATSTVSSANAFLSVAQQATLTGKHKYGLMLDAGSSGSRLHIFKWPLGKEADLIEIMLEEADERQLRTETPLASFADSPADAGPALSKIIKAAVQHIPEGERGKSPLFVKATAGMRLLSSTKANAVLQAVRKHLANPDNCPFKFATAEIISGEEEAVFSYIASNYRVHKLILPEDATIGTLEMGGASMQVAFKPSSDIQDNEFQFYVSGLRRSIYAKSYIRFGADEALARLVKLLAGEWKDTEIVSPCHNPGYNSSIIIDGRALSIVGAGNMSNCIPLVRRLLGLDIECLMPPCALFGSYMPQVSGNFYAIASFFYTANGLGLVGWDESKPLTGAEIATAADAFCAKDFSDAVDETGKSAHYVGKYCFLATYQTQTLEALGFQPSDASVIYSRIDEGKQLGWTAGAMLYETQLMPLNIRKGDGRDALCGSHDASSRSHTRHSMEAVSPKTENATKAVRSKNSTAARLSTEPGSLAVRSPALRVHLDGLVACLFFVALFHVLLT